MQQYIGTKIVQAEPMDQHTAFDVRPDGDHAISANRDGYHVVPQDESDLWVTKDVFEKTFRPCDAMNFGLAIEAMKAGKKVARSGWNGKGMFIVLMGPLYLPPYNTQGTERKVNDRTAKWIGEDNPLDSQPYFAMFTAKGQWQPGWLASQADMLAEDWMIVE